MVLRDFVIYFVEKRSVIFYFLLTTIEDIIIHGYSIRKLVIFLRRDKSAYMLELGHNFLKLFLLINELLLNVFETLNNSSVEYR